MVRIAKPVPFTSRVDQILNVKLTKFFEYGKHQLICGSSGAGKTSTLLLMVKLLMDNGETIIWRDDSSMEALSLVEKYKLRIFVPAGCRIYYQHPNIEYVEYDPTKLTPTVFDKLEKGYVHVIEFDLFTMDMTFFIDFWSRFFYEFYKWKNTRPHWPMAFFTDELNDLAPSVRRGYIPRQLQLSSQIFFSLKKFRKERIRLVACYDKQTRALTAEGLKTYEQLRIGDLVLSLNPDTRAIEWKPITNLFSYDYHGDLTHFQGKSFDVNVTPNHTMFIETFSRWSGWNLKRESAEDAAQRNSFRFPAGIWSKPGLPSYSNDFFYLIGLYIGDGGLRTHVKEWTKSGLRRSDLSKFRDDANHFGKWPDNPQKLTYHRPRATLFIPPKDKSRQKVEAALARLGVTWNNDHRGNIYFSTEDSLRFEDVFKECGDNAENKHVPRRFLDECSAEQLFQTWDGLHDSDGHGKHVYSTVSAQLSCDVVEIAIKQGWSATIKTKPPRETKIKDHIAHSKGFFRISIKFTPKGKQNDKRKNLQNVSRESYDGLVWCPEVADNHNLLIERNGRFVFCGNSTHGYGDIHKPVREAFNFYLLKKMSEGEVPDILWRFTKMVQRLQLDEMVIIDEEHSFNRMHIKEFVKPRKFTVRFSGDLKPTSQKKLEESAAFNQKITLLAQLLHEGFNVPWSKMAELLGYSNPSGLTGLMKRQDLDSIKAKVKIFMSQLETMEETEEEKSLIVD
jgi:hypothetical protein